MSLFTVQAEVHDKIGMLYDDTQLWVTDVLCEVFSKFSKCAKFTNTANSEGLYQDNSWTVDHPRSIEGTAGLMMACMWVCPQRLSS